VMAMTISFGSLLKEHDAEMRCIPIAALRAAFWDVDLRLWQSWRERCGVPRCARLGSRLSALKLWILASCNGQKDDNEIRIEVAYRLNKSPDSIERWLNAFDAPVGGGDRTGQSVSAVANAITELAPDVVVTHRNRLYEWFDRAGLRFSTRETYTHQQLLRVVTEARRSQRKGRWESTYRRRSA
jgi:hypothetical protein